MDFEQILKKWESQSNGSNTPRKEGMAQAEHWVESYSPREEHLAEKEIDPIRPASEGRSIWRRRPHQDVLDLHGLTREESVRELAYFVQSMRRRGLRKGLIIHGKGLHSPDGAVLAPVVRDYLESSSEIGEFRKATGKNGGSGATWFILRHRSR